MEESIAKSDAGKSGPNQRSVKNFLINPAYQLRYVAMLVGCSLILTLVNAAIFYGYSRQNYMLVVDLNPLDSELKARLAYDFRTVIFELGISAVIFAAWMSVLGVILSHRTAGAMFNLKRVFKKIKDGDLDSRAQFRPTDDFHDVAHSLNEMLDSLSPKKPPQ